MAFLPESGSIILSSSVALFSDSSTLWVLTSDSSIAGLPEASLLATLSLCYTVKVFLVWLKSLKPKEERAALVMLLLSQIKLSSWVKVESHFSCDWPLHSFKIKLPFSHSSKTSHTFVPFFCPSNISFISFHCQNYFVHLHQTAHFWLHQNSFQSTPSSIEICSSSSSNSSTFGCVNVRFTVNVRQLCSWPPLCVIRVLFQSSTYNGKSKVLPEEKSQQRDGHSLNLPFHHLLQICLSSKRPWP